MRDTIAANPPFVPVPDGLGFPIHSNGGADGNALTRILLARLDSLLAPQGQALLTTFQVEDEDGPLLARDVEELVRNRPAEFTRRRKNSFEFDEMVSEYRATSPHRASAIDRWSDQLKTRYGSRLSFNYYVVHIGQRSERPTEFTIRDCDGAKYGTGFSLDNAKDNPIGGEIRRFAEKRNIEASDPGDA